MVFTSDLSFFSSKLILVPTTGRLMRTLTVQVFGWRDGTPGCRADPMRMLRWQTAIILPSRGSAPTGVKRSCATPAKKAFDSKPWRDLQFVNLDHDSGVSTLTLSRGRANAFNLQLVEELTEAVEKAHSDESTGALVFTSAQPGFFSAGFDVTEVFAYPVSAMRYFLERFVDLYESILRFEKPVIGALRGHTIAGGAFLALTFDMRIMAEGEYYFGLNEINFAAIVPPTVQRMLINAVGAREATRMILTGDGVKPDRALKMGLVDRVLPDAGVLADAAAIARELATKPSEVFRFTKRSLRKLLGYPDISEDRGFIDEFLKQWFSPECIERRQALSASHKR